MPAQTGKLRIGDEWNAITLLARTQTNPLKAVAELIENAIDAQAENVDLIRSRKAGRLLLTICDDGRGVPTGPDGLPDFKYVATHIGDSMKRKLQDRQSRGIHGEFGIGLLGFWSLGQELRLASRGIDGRLHEMVLRAGEPGYRIQRALGKLPLPGAEVIVSGLHDEIKKTLSADRLERYLALELRDRIRQRGVQIRILDRVSRKTLVVRPRQFEGERVAGLDRLPVPGFGEAIVELYYRVPREGETLSVGICRDGTRVVRDLGTLEGFDGPPWTLGRLEGVIDFAGLSTAPGTREGIVPDAAYAAFAQALRAAGPSLTEWISHREAAQAERASENILKDIRRALTEALRGLPEGEYHWFDVGRGAPDRPPSDPSPASDPGKGAAEAEERPGPLHSVRIRPAHATVPPHTTRSLTAIAYDAHGKRLDAGVSFAWRVAEGPARIVSAQNETASVEALAAGTTAEIEAAAVQGDRSASARALLYLEEVEPSLAPEDGDGQSQGLPGYRLVHAPGDPWRSRYVPRENAIEVNSGHRDYAQAREKVKLLRRYVAKLYAKEIVLLNFPEANSPAAMERLIELLTRMEERL